MLGVAHSNLSAVMNRRKGQMMSDKAALFQQTLVKETILANQTTDVKRVIKAASAKLKDLGLEVGWLKIFANRALGRVWIAWQVEGSQYGEELSFLVSRIDDSQTDIDFDDCPHCSKMPAKTAAIISTFRRLGFPVTHLIEGGNCHCLNVSIDDDGNFRASLQMVVFAIADR